MQAVEHKLRTEAGPAIYKCGRPSWNRSAVKSRNVAACGGSACVAWAVCGWSGN